MEQDFVEAMQAGYALGEPACIVGSPTRGGEVAAAVRVQMALAMANRHGLIAGATGTGKTKTLQILAGELSDAGVPVFISDIKGDVTGIAAPGDPTNPKLPERCAALAWDYHPEAHPVEFLSLSGKLGAQVRATVHSFGPLLLAKVMDLNETQTAVLTLVFRYCDDGRLPLLDLADLRTTLQYLGSDEGKAALAGYGGMSTATLGVLLRSIVTLEESGAADFFGEPEFDVQDLLRLGPDGKGIVSVLELSDVMDKPRLFSTFMLWLLAQLYHELPEMGDLPKPKLAFFFDEAHLLFREASKALLEQIELTVRLIRSKGVGVFFATQTPTDVPSSVLAQLGSRFQHALRAFTPEDADNLRKTARTFPISAFYDVEQVITSLGIGEALVTVLSPKGVPTPLAATLLVPPDSSMASLPPSAFAALVASGSLRARYGASIDRQSAHEIITARLQSAQAAAVQAAAAPPAATTVPGGQAYDQPPQVSWEARQRQVIYEEGRRSERDQQAAERARRADEKERAATERARQKTIDTTVRTAGKVVTSRAGQDLLRTVFGTLFGGKR
ncbi:MAG: helicase HerA-like domain-containing protein [Candidatus Limnocylindrales bacterium]